MIKRFLSMFLAFLMLFGSIPVDTFATTISGNQIVEKNVSGNNETAQILINEDVMDKQLEKISSDCLVVKSSAPVSANTKAGGLYQLDMGDVFEEMQGHEVTYNYSFNSTVDHTFTKLQNGVLYLTPTTQNEGDESYELILTATCGSRSVNHTVKLTVEPPNEGIAEQYNYDETDKTSVKVYVTISNDGMPLLGSDYDETPLANLKVEVPYFELGLYGLEEYNRYGTENGKGTYINETVIKRPTALHLYIYLLERYYMGLEESECCLGTSGVLEYAETKDIFYFSGDEAFSSGNNQALVYSGGATSIFMNQFWGHDCNLMYYRNHCYPYMSPGWGATSDYILLSDGDTIDIAMFTDWNFYHSGYFASFDQDCYNVKKPGSELTVETRKWGTSASAESFVDVNGSECLSVALYSSDWQLIQVLSYDSDEKNTITFNVPEEGIYYLMALDPNVMDKTEAKIAPAVSRVVVTSEEEESGTKPEIAGQFILMAINKDGIIIEPSYVPYVEGATLKESLKASGYIFEGIESGYITAIEGVVDGYSFYYDDGGYSLDTQASDITAVYFTANSTQKFNDDLLNLIIQMETYLSATNGVKDYVKAKTAYETAEKEFYNTKNASKLYNDLKDAMNKYNTYLNGELINLPLIISMDDQTITSGKAVFQSEFETDEIVFEEWSNGVALRPGCYTFDISDGEFRHVRGTIEISDSAKLVATLPSGKWLESLDLSIQYGDNWKAVEKVNESDSSATYFVPDYSSTSLYPYAVCAVDSLTHKLFEVGSSSPRTWKSHSTTLAHIIDANSLNDKSIVLEVRLMENPDGYEQYQIFAMNIQRIPSLEGLSVMGDGTSLKLDFDKDVKEYTVLTTSDSVDIKANALCEVAEMTIAGKVVNKGTLVNIELDDYIKDTDGKYEIPVVVTAANGQKTSYTVYVVKVDALQVILNSPNLDASVELFNDAGAKVEPISVDGTYYIYNVVSNNEYTYIVTENEVYHASSKFSITESQTISLPRPKIEENWLNTLSLKAGSDSNKGAPVYELTPEFNAKTHVYSTNVESNTSVFYLKAFANDTTAYKTEAIFNAHDNTKYKGTEECKTIINKNYNKINQFLSSGGWGNDMLIRVTQNDVEDGVNYYQDYNIRVNREMTLFDLSVNDNNGETLVLTQKNSDTTGFEKQKYEYNASIGSTAKEMTVSFKAINTSTAYDYDQYNIFVKCGEFEENIAYAEEEMVIKEQRVTVPLNGTEESENIEIILSHKGNGSIDGIYTIELTKLPAVIIEINPDPIDATVFITEELFGTRIYPEENGKFNLKSGQKYKYIASKYGYVSASEVFIANKDKERIDVKLEKAPDNTLNNIAMKGDWLQFRADSNNNGVVNSKTPIKAEDTVLEWSNKIGDGFDTGATGCPIIVGGYIYTYAGNAIVKLNKDTGEIVDSGIMAASSSFAINSPTYAEGMIFVGLSDGRVQAFNAETLDSLWLFTDNLGGQPNCPIVYHNGYIYTGFWNSEVSNANFVCISVTDEDPTNNNEIKLPTWTYTHNGFYWAGAYVSDEFVLVGTDDGNSGYTNGYASLLSLDPKTGILLDTEQMTNVGDQRSSICYDEVTDAYYFTTKGGDFYQIMVDDNGEFVKNSLYRLHLDNYANSNTNPPMSTSTPVIYNGRAYIGVSGISQFGAYSGHNITVIDLNTFSIAYTVPTQGYPQVSGLLTNAYEEDGYVYVYFIDNYTPGKLRVIRDNPDMTEVDHTYTTIETYISGGKTETVETGYVLFTPDGSEAQYAICSPISDAEGNIYFKNDSARMMKISSRITELVITQNPNKVKYDVGMKFDGTGMKVSASYANGMMKDITKYVSYTTEPLTSSDTEITVSFTPDKMFVSEDTAKGGFWRWYQDSEGKVGVKYNLPKATATIEIHMHQCSKVAAKPATCTEKGNIEHYKCSDCSKLFSDKNGQIEITNVSVAAKGHDYDDGKVTKKATATVNGTKTFTCKNNCGSTKKSTIYAASEIELSNSTYVYSGAKKKPTVTVKTSKGTTLKNGTDYTISYATGRKNVGRYKVTVTFKGTSYNGSKIVYFTIVPKKTTSVTANLGTTSGGYDDIKLIWKKCTGATGYLVYYKKASEKKWSAPINVTSNTTYTKKNLSDGVKYTFKVVPYYQNSNSTTKYYDENEYRTASIYTLKKISTPTLSKTGSKVKVKWTNIDGETGYQISQSTSKTKTNIVVTYKTSSGKSKTISATKGKTYYYKVRAYKVVDGKNVYGPWSTATAYKR